MFQAWNRLSPEQARNGLGISTKKRGVQSVGGFLGMFNGNGNGCGGLTSVTVQGQKKYETTPGFAQVCLKPLPPEGIAAMKERAKRLKSSQKVVSAT